MMYNSCNSFKHIHSTLWCYKQTLIIALSSNWDFVSWVEHFNQLLKTLIWRGLASAAVIEQFLYIAVAYHECRLVVFNYVFASSGDTSVFFVTGCWCSSTLFFSTKLSSESDTQLSLSDMPRLVLLSCTRERCHIAIWHIKIHISITADSMIWYRPIR